MLLNKHNKIYNNLLLSITLSISITIFCVAIVLYFNFEKVVLSLQYSHYKDNLFQVSYSASYMYDSVRGVAAQLYFNEKTKKLLTYSKVDHDDISAALNNINTDCLTMPILQSVYLYNGETDTFYSNIPNYGISSSKHFYDTGIADIIHDFSGYKMLSPIERTVSSTLSGHLVDYDVVTFVFSAIPYVNGNLQNAVIINVSQNWIDDIIENISTNTGSKVLIVDNDGVIINGTEKYEESQSSTWDICINTILHSNLQESYFIDKVDGTTSLISYTTYKPFNWKFISITPYNDVLKKVNSMKITTCIFGLIILLFGLAISFLLSINLYKPIKIISDRIVPLTISHNILISQQKQQFLQNILCDTVAYSEDNLNKVLNDFKIRTPICGNYLLVLFRIDFYFDFCVKNKPEDRKLLRYEAMNVISELFEKYFPIETVDMDNDRLIAIIGGTENLSREFVIKIKEIVHEIQSNTIKAIDMSLSAFISNMESASFCDLKYLYENADEAANYRTFYGHGCVVYSKDIKYKDSQDYVYPNHLEMMLLDALKAGNIEETKRAYSQIIQCTEGYSYSIWRSAILHITFAIFTDLLLSENRVDVSGFDTIDHFISAIDRNETLNEVNELFYSFFSDIVKKMVDKKSKIYDKLINRIMVEIGEDYSDMNLSLESIADKIGMSSAYLGRQFKKATSKSVSEFISEARLEKSKELLIKSNYSANEVSQMVGFINNSYFFTYFKKMTGLTPNVFRNKYKSNE